MSGCGGVECELGQVRCRENVAESCDYAYSDADEVSWVGEDCDQGACKLGSQGPFCAFDEQPDARCGPDATDSTCDGASLLQCRDGYAVSVKDCVTGQATSASGRTSDSEPAGYCVAGSLCSTEPEPSELCPKEDFASRCDENALIQCQSGYIASRLECGALFCAVTPGYADCMLEPEPSPLCPSDAIAYVCDEASVVECHYGYRAFEQTCEAGRSCTPAASGAFCGDSP